MSINGASVVVLGIPMSQFRKMCRFGLGWLRVENGG